MHWSALQFIIAFDGRRQGFDALQTVELDAKVLHVSKFIVQFIIIITVHPDHMANAENAESCRSLKHTLHEECIKSWSPMASIGLTTFEQALCCPS